LRRNFVYVFFYSSELFRPFVDPPTERDPDFSDHPYQQHLSYYEQAHASKLIKNNLKISELMTDPSYAYQTKRVCIFVFIALVFR
jgi:hypothetical protein